VAEDEPINQMILADNLAEDGATVVMVGNGQEALDRIVADGAEAYDIVLMDLQMPAMDGYEATRRIPALAPDLPIVAQTAHALEEEREKCRAAGMAGHIAKLIDPMSWCSPSANMLDQESNVRLSGARSSGYTGGSFPR
jgi:CheY-like chemotaxis protein